MIPQHVAGQSSPSLGFEASESQVQAIASCGYLFATACRRLASRFPQRTYTSRGTGLRDCLARLNRNCDRRLICPRASNCWPYLALRSQRPRVRAKHRLKSSSWLTLRRFLSSQHTQVSTSNLSAEQAFAPAPTRLATRIGGASWL